jgi:hypothetical protein
LFMDGRIYLFHLHNSEWLRPKTQVLLSVVLGKTI